MSLKGKGGNNGSGWYFERPLPELRQIMGVPEGTYKETHLFKQYVIEKPIKEINNAGIGLEIMPETIKQGRRIVAIRFDCKQAPRTAKGKNKGRKKAVVLSEPNLKTVAEREEKELQHLKELYPDEFAELYATELENAPEFIKAMEFGKIAAEGSALLQLRERHGIVK
jgi:plasmid replication initiation protein